MNLILLSAQMIGRLKLYKPLFLGGFLRSLKTTYHVEDTWGVHGLFEIICSKQQ